MVRVRAQFNGLRHPHEAFECTFVAGRKTLAHDHRREDNDVRQTRVDSVQVMRAHGTEQEVKH
jgi:hypothetical protein